MDFGSNQPVYRVKTSNPWRQNSDAIQGIAKLAPISCLQLLGVQAFWFNLGV